MAYQMVKKQDIMDYFRSDILLILEKTKKNNNMSEFLFY